MDGPRVDEVWLVCEVPGWVDMPVLGRDHRVIGALQSSDFLGDLVAAGGAQRAAGAEVMLDVDNHECTLHGA